MDLRIIALTALLAFGAITLDGAPVTEDLKLPTFAPAAAADTCDGWPHPIPKLLDACPHGPTI